MVKSYAIVYSFLQVVILDILNSVLVQSRFEQMFMLKLFSSLNHILTKFNGLPSRMDKHKNLLATTEMPQHHIIAFLVVYVSYISFSGDVVTWIFWVFYADEVDQKRNWPVTGIEVEKTVVPWHSHEISYVKIIGKSSTQTNQPNPSLRPLYCSEQPSNYTFNNPTPLIVEQVHFIKNKQVKSLHGCSSFSRSHIKFLRSCHEDVGCSQFFLGKLNISSTLPSFQVRKFSSKFLNQFVCQSFHGGYVNNSDICLSIASVYGIQHSQSGYICLSSSSGGTNQHVLYSSVGSLEDNALDFIQVVALEATVKMTWDHL